VSKHYLITIGKRQVFADRIDGFSFMERQSGISPPHAEFTVFMSNGTSFKVEGEEPKVAKEHEHLADILLDQEQDDGDHPQGQSG
jgi:hypothetical protein